MFLENSKFFLIFLPFFFCRVVFFFFGYSVVMLFAFSQRVESSFIFFVFGSRSWRGFLVMRLKFQLLNETQKGRGKFQELNPLFWGFKEPNLLTVLREVWFGYCWWDCDVFVWFASKYDTQKTKKHVKYKRQAVWPKKTRQTEGEKKKKKT